MNLVEQYGEFTNLRNCLIEDDYKRRSGKTTRQVDLAIQILFEDGIVEIKDHFENGTKKAANKMLFERIRNRLDFEYRYLSSKSMIKYYTTYNKKDIFVIELNEEVYKNIKNR